MAKTTLVIFISILLIVSILFLIPAAVSDWTAEGPTWDNTSYDNTRIQRSTDNIIIDWNPSNETSRWTMDENTGTDIHDENATNTNDGILTGNWTTPGIVNLTYPLDIINVSADPSLEGFSELTVCSLVYPTADPGANYGRIVSKAQGTTGDDYALMQIGSSAPTIQNRSAFRINTDEGNEIAEGTTILYPNTDWFFVCGRWNGTHIDIVLDGVVDTTTPKAIGGTLDDSNLNLGIGRHPYDASGDRSFNGNVGDTYVIGSFLTLQQITDLMNNTMHGSGNITVTYDAGVGNQVSGYNIKLTTSTNTNITLTYADNDTSAERELGTGIPAEDGWINGTVSGTLYQDASLILTLVGNQTETPIVESVTFQISSSSVADPTNLSNTTGDYWVNSTWDDSVDANSWQVMVYEA